MILIQDSQPDLNPATNRSLRRTFGWVLEYVVFAIVVAIVALKCSTSWAQYPTITSQPPGWFGQHPLANDQIVDFSQMTIVPPGTSENQPTITTPSAPSPYIAGNSEQPPVSFASNAYHYPGAPVFLTDQLAQIQPPQVPTLGFSPPPTLFEPTWKTVDSPELVYDAKYPVPVQRPGIEWGRQFYAPGMLEPGGRIFGEFNLTHPMFLLYGDFRTGFGVGENAADSFNNLAARLNLDLDFWITSTERFHGFIGPLNNGNQFTQVNFDGGDLDFEGVFNANLVNGYFEGDLGYMMGGLTNNPAQFDLPVAAGLMPLLYQNGIWMEDVVTGVALAQNAKHSRLLKWSNFDATVFAIFDQMNSPVFGNDNHAGQALGTAWFIDAYGGYIETGYAYIHDRKDLGRSYHNATIAFTRRYFDRISNSVRFIVNTGQDLPKNQRTADGGLVILENSWITANPLTFVPYMNVFYGYGRPQSVARAGGAGGILRNVGITFETDGLNGYPTLDDSAINTVGGAVGVNLLGASLNRQLILEASIVHGYGSDANRVTNGDQYGVGARYQFPISHATLLRFDTMYGFRASDNDLYGARAEFRYKF